MNSNLLTIKWFYNSDIKSGILKLDDISPGRCFCQAHGFMTIKKPDGIYIGWPGGEIGTIENSYWPGNSFKPLQIQYLPRHLFGIYCRNILTDITLVDFCKFHRSSLREKIPVLNELYAAFPESSEDHYDEKGHAINEGKKELEDEWFNPRNYEALYPDHPLYYESWMLREPEYWKKYYIP